MNKGSATAPEEIFSFVSSTVVGFFCISSCVLEALLTTKVHEILSSGPYSTLRRRDAKSKRERVPDYASDRRVMRNELRVAGDGS